ncbi:heparinase II/III family protein [Pedobacter sp. AW1-32]|uniref:heparinase II/III domain-containing protein n=1 Tax=Pedobacter sp. AW1-32 TaxID=3383026 RepID=UPI003FEE1FEB
MNKLILTALMISEFAFVAKAQLNPRNWLTYSYNKAYSGAAAFPNLSSWQQKNKLAVLQSIAALPDTIKQNLVKKADDALTYNWPSLPASLYLDYRETGTRVNYENLQGERRKILSNLVVGELIRNDERYIPKIVDGLWLILEESTWVAPAHITVQKEGADLANIVNPYIDLNASQTGANVAMIYHLLSDKFAKYSKILNGRILYELNRRIFDPYLKYDTFWWMGFKGNAVNNWNSFNNTNIMQTALLVSEPGDSLTLLSKKILASTDFFINQYPEDGGCDEGPSYWDMAGGKLVQLLSLIGQASEDKITLSDRQLIHDMGSYTYKMQISGNKMVNFADAFANYTQDPVSVYTYGKLFNDDVLKEYAAYLFNERKRKISSDDLINFTAITSVSKRLTATETKSPYPEFAVLPNLKVFVARMQKGTDKGLFLAAKGGHNGESHNHNDIGNFIVYADGSPVIIDAGVGTYTSKTFSNKRYELWNVQSQWHNTPNINGYEQKDGSSYKATEFKVKHNKSVDVLSMDISNAYPQEASVKSWRRIWTFDRYKKEIILRDQFDLEKVLDKNTLNFMSAEKPQITNGTLKWKNGVSMFFDAQKFDIRIEEKPMDDIRLKNVWGDFLYRIQLQAKNKIQKGEYTLKISQ